MSEGFLHQATDTAVGNGLSHPWVLVLRRPSDFPKHPPCQSSPNPTVVIKL